MKHTPKSIRTHRYCSGLLASARPAEGARIDYAPASQELLAKANRIADVCEAHGVTLPEVAIAFPLAHPVVAGVVIGMRSPEEVRRNLASFETEVPAGLGRSTQRGPYRRPGTRTEDNPALRVAQQLVAEGAASVEQIAAVARSADEVGCVKHL